MKNKMFTGILLVLVLVLSASIAHATSATASAVASNIVSELRNCKAATAMYLADSLTSPDVFPNPVPNVNNFDRIRPYLDNAEKVTSDRFMFYVVGDVWWVGIKLGPGSFWADFWGYGTGPWNLTKNDREKLENRAKTVGLYGTSDPTVPPVSNDLAGLYKKQDVAVWMRAR